ncbi:MAG: exo-alpha-sialidase [Ruminococcaceae bacterium]|nr:exo-alpha-sialidase [Oscillospiraceae bacterium]
MKINFKVISVIIIFSMLLLNIGCGKKNMEYGGPIGESETTENQTEPVESEKINTEPYFINLDGYTVIYPKNATDKLIGYLEKFCELLEDYTGAKIDLASDAKSEQGKEILLGNTSRKESGDAKDELSKHEKQEGAYIIRNYGEKIAIAGRNEKVIIRAMKRFLMNYAKASETEKSVLFSHGEREIGVLNTDSMLFENFTEMYVETQSTIASLQSSKEPDSYVYSYESIIELAHNGEDNGTLIATYTVYSKDTRRIYKSTDGGESWDCISYVRNTISENSIKSSMQASLFELPRDMGRFKAGTLFLADSTYVTNSDGIEATEITLYYSTDLGKNWTSYCQLKSGLNYSVHLGVYEPFLYYDEETERVYCFYADETYPKASEGVQKLVCHYTDDMDNWSATVDVINGDDTAWRPGMPCVTRMGNGEYFLVYEIYEESMGAPVYYQKLNSLNEFRSKDYGTHLVTADGKSIGASPWCAWTPAGGECGTLVVVGSGSNKAIWGQSDMFLSFDYGETFIAIKNPVQVLSYGVRKIGYSPSVFFSSDGETLHYCTNTADFNCRVSVIYSNIKIW